MNSPSSPNGAQDNKSPSKLPRRTPLATVVAGLKYLFSLSNNTISILGFLLLAVALILFLGVWLLSTLHISLNPYLEGAIVLFAPGLFFLGLIVVPLGIHLVNRRSLKQGTVPGSLEITIKDRRFRGSVGILFVVTMLVVIPVIAVSGYKVYHLTESTAFCGEFCHTVMQPQAIAHSRSPHARVRCAECHIGSGADFFVKSKISGMRQIYAVAFDTYPRPIPPAITELRPARDTCEECHWPSKFFGTQYKKVVHYASDEANTRRDVEMMVKTGGKNLITGEAEGIHMHMLAEGDIEYIAVDEGLQEIPWVRHTSLDGTVKIYTKEGATGKQAPPKGIRRQIDCMDCHNRGAHHFASPHVAIDVELESKRIDRTLPYIVREGVNALLKPYQSREEAAQGIEAHLTEFYQKSYPEVFKERKPKVDQAIERVNKVYEEQFFPYMKEDWRQYPENVGHQYSKGCFRCHDGLHTDEKGKAISTDCTNCHLFVRKEDRGLDCLQFGDFGHPNSLSIHQNVLCSKCHGTGKIPACQDCHKNENWRKLRGTGEFRADPSLVSSENYEPFDEALAKDKLFRLIEPKNEWKLTEPIRQIRSPEREQRAKVDPQENDSPGGDGEREPGQSESRSKDEGGELQ